MIETFGSTYAHSHRSGLARVGLVFWSAFPATDMVDFAIAVRTQGWTALGLNINGIEEMIESEVVMGTFEAKVPFGGLD